MQKPILILLRVIGILLILIGIIAAYYGPLEIYVFYLFSEGGRFYYDGFGVGSFWFAALVVQNLGYYVVAALCLPVGIGHLKLRRWALTLTRLYSWFWLGAGILIVVNLLLLLPAALRLDLSREVLLARSIMIGVVSLISLILLPVFVLWFYDREMVRGLFEARDPKQYWTERYPFPLLALLLLYAIMISVLHIAIFFQSLFPLFGQLVLGRQPVYLISLCILILGILVVGVAGLKRGAWWGSIIFISLLTISSALTFSRHSFYEIVLMMDLPAYELEFLDGLVLIHDFHLVGLIVPPLLVALGLIIYSKRYWIHV